MQNMIVKKFFKTLDNYKKPARKKPEKSTDENKSRGIKPFSNEENNIIIEHVNQYGLNEHGNPNQINILLNKLPGRNQRQVYNRWRNWLNPNVTYSSFTAEEVYFIITLFPKLGRKWSLYKLYLPNRNITQIRNLFDRTILPFAKNLHIPLTDDISPILLQQLIKAITGKIPQQLGFPLYYFNSLPIPPQLYQITPIQNRIELAKNKANKYNSQSNQNDQSKNTQNKRPYLDMVLNS